MHSEGLVASPPLDVSCGDENSNMNCQSCGSEHLDTFLNLGNQPICNRFSKVPEDHPKYPLKVAFCPRCFLVQLAEYPSSEEVFNEQYSYLTGTTPEANDYFDTLAYVLTKRYGLTKDKMVLDIGGNDGTFLSRVKYHSGAKVLNVDPASTPTAKASVPTERRRFEDYKGPTPDLVTAFNVLAHADRIHELLEKIRSFECPLVAQNHYLLRLLEWKQYDTIYHEHLRYYSFRSFRQLLEMHDLGIQDVDEVEYYGGSFITHVLPGPSAGFFWKETFESKLTSSMTYHSWANTVNDMRDRLVRTLDEQRQRGLKIVGAGAPMKCSTLLNYCGIGPETIDCIAERNPLKIGTYVPGVNIPVVSYETAMKSKPDVVLILAWNATRSVISSLKSLGFHGRFLIPIPEPMML